MLKTRHVFVDTQAFVASNFFQSRNLQRLANYGEIGTVNIYLTEITIHEIKNNIENELQIAQQVINQYHGLINSKGKILKNIEEFNDYFELPKLDISHVFGKLQNTFENFMNRGNIKLIPISLANINDVSHWYMTQRPPFSSGGKKHEFPDAIVLSALDNWCIAHEIRLYIISNDKDVKSFKSGNLIVLSTLREILDKIIKQHYADTVKWIERIYQSNKGRISEKIGAIFKERVLDELQWDFEILSMEILSVEFENYSIVEGESFWEFVLQIDYEITFSAKVRYDDYSMSIYDKEEDKYYFSEKNETYIEVTTKQTAEISVETIYEPGDEADKAEVEISYTHTSIPDASIISNELVGYIDVF